jgi:hypothetical protein
VSRIAPRTTAGPGKVRRVAEHACDEGVSALESALHAALVEAGIAGFVPQLRIRLRLQPSSRRVRKASASLVILRSPS